MTIRGSRRADYRFRGSNLHLQAEARVAFKKARRRRELVPGPCARCGRTDGIHAHHEDYARPLDVVWLCRLCHMWRHQSDLPLDEFLEAHRHSTAARLRSVA